VVEKFVGISIGDWLLNRLQFGRNEIDRPVDAESFPRVENNRLYKDPVTRRGSALLSFYHLGRGAPRLAAETFPPLSGGAIN